tara:strand:+ start:290 stop:553 length:264 start_codon:yes stop_codon:yes gene_type:complete
MADPIKFTPEEIQEIQGVQSLYNAIVTQAGQVYLEELSLDKKKDQLESNFDEIRSKESEIISTLTTKYGQGQINLETGEFIPADSED